MLTELRFQPGVYKDDSPLSAEGFFIDTQNVRFRRGKAQTVGGWEKASTSTVTGKARALKAWSDNDATKRLAIATHLRLYAMDLGGGLTDITPEAGSSTLVNAFSTTASSSTVSIAWGSDHPLFEGQKINFTSASAVGGITLDGDYTVTVTNASTIAVEHGSAAASTASGGGSAIATYYVAGNENGLGGLGFGVGVFSSGAFGLAATGYDLNPLTYSLDLWDQDILANPRGGKIYAYSPGSTIAQPLTNAPTQNTCIFVTQERSLVSCGNNGVAGAGTFDPRNVRWTKLGDRTSWAASATVSAGDTTVSHGGRLVRGMPGVGQNYLWTLDGMWTMTFIPDPTVVYRLDRVGFDNCGLIGPNAVAMLEGVPYWMSPSGQFYTYQGRVMQLNCTVRRDTFDNISRAQADKVYAFPCAAYGEVWFLVPDKRDGNECSRAVIYNTLEQTWATTLWDRTAGEDAGVYPFPIEIGTDGAIYFHEKGNSDNGGPLSWSMTAAPYDIGDGHRSSRVVRIKDEPEDLQGGYTVTINSRRSTNSGKRTETAGPYSFVSSTGSKAVRAWGDDHSLVIEGSDSPTFYRMGTFKADIRMGPRTR